MVVICKNLTLCFRIQGIGDTKERKPCNLAKKAAEEGLGGGTPSRLLHFLCVLCQLWSIFPCSLKSKEWSYGKHSLNALQRSYCLSYFLQEIKLSKSMQTLTTMNFFDKRLVHFSCCCTATLVIYKTYFLLLCFNFVINSYSNCSILYAEVE